jgi:hypothetical protein
MKIISRFDKDTFNIEEEAERGKGTEGARRCWARVGKEIFGIQRRGSGGGRGGTRGDRWWEAGDGLMRIAGRKNGSSGHNFP